MTTEVVSMAPKARALIQAHQQLNRDSPSLSERQMDKRLEEIDTLLVEALSDLQATADLVELLGCTSDYTERWFLQDRILPPRTLALTDPETFRAHPLVRLTADEMPIKPCLALVEVGAAEVPDVIGDPEEPGELGWFAGLPADDGSGDWPRNDAGEPLSHVAQVDLSAYTWGLGEDDPRLSEVLGVPDSGVLQLFHDRENYGNVDDEAAGSWLVRWVQKPMRLLDRPEDLPERYFAPPAALATALVATVPSFVTYEGPNEDRYERVAEHLSAARRDEPNLFGLPDSDDSDFPSAWEEDFQPLDGDESSLGGFGYHEWTEDLSDILDAKLPLSRGDEHVLLFDVAGVRALEDWFGDSGHLQAWMRSSDLEDRVFDRVWCVIRTD